MANRFELACPSRAENVGLCRVAAATFAANAGFSVGEIEEIKAAQNLEEVTAELGDLFFVLVNLARWRKVDAESALRATNLKFKKRFGYVEKGAKAQGRSLSDMTLEEMDALWNEAKRM